MQKFTLYFVIQFISYALACWNIRSVSNAWYINIAISDAMIAAINFKVIKKIAKEEDVAGPALYGYICGGFIGSIVSVWLTKHFIG